MPAPPPPPPPLPSFGGGPPPPPPPPPGGAPTPRPTANRVSPLTTKTRKRGQASNLPVQGALNSDITKGIKLRKAVTNDRSAPAVAGKPADGPVGGGLAKPPSFGAPPVPGGAPRVPSGSGAPRMPSGGAPPRPRASSGSYGAQENSGGGFRSEPAPQLAGLFAGGMPKLRSRGGGVNTGASRDSTYSDNSDTNTTPPRPAPAPFKPSGLPPRVPSLRPTVPSAPSAPNFRKPPPAPIKRPASSVPLRQSQSSPASPPRTTPPPPPPPGSLAPRPPVPAFRKTPSPTPSYGVPNSAPPPPPPPPSSTAPRPPSLPRAPPPPPPPPPTNGTSSRPNAPPPPPPPAQGRSWNDASSFTLSGLGTAGRKVVIDDKRWRFKREQDLPDPRPFTGMVKVYRSGRGSSVPLNLKSLE